MSLFQSTTPSDHGTAVTVYTTTINALKTNLHETLNCQITIHYNMFVDEDVPGKKCTKRLKLFRK